MGGQSAGTLAAPELRAEGIQPRAPVLAELIKPAVYLATRTVPAFEEHATEIRRMLHLDTVGAIDAVDAAPERFH